MKKINDVFMSMVYPMLISLFIFSFVSAFVKDSSLEPLQLISALLALIFGLLFVIGFICKIIYALKNKNNS